jgi:hypothetical protein
VKPLADLVARAALAVNPLILPLAIVCGLALAAVALSLAVLCRVRALVGEAALDARTDRQLGEAAIESLRQEWNGLAAQLQEIRREAASATAPALPRPGLNLSKRSQALHMHRRGAAPVEIASALGVPLQEVDLLLKVHRIVISNI